VRAGFELTEQLVKRGRCRYYVLQRGRRCSGLFGLYNPAMHIMRVGPGYKQS
jgi:hypothetical protein